MHDATIKCNGELHIASNLNHFLRLGRPAAPNSRKIRKQPQPSDPHSESDWAIEPFLSDWAVFMPQNSYKEMQWHSTGQLQTSPREN